jgi:phosphoribosylaminoimidazolecarboxamide formyltransferase/IMP cyclohydrolase
MAHIISSIAGSQSDLCKIKRALISVSDKSKLIELATFLASQGVELLSTGGTASALRAAGGQNASDRQRTCRHATFIFCDHLD